jgi:zinc protease
VFLIDRPGSTQSVIVAAQLAPPRNNPNTVENGLVNEVFGGSFSSRINMNLREDKHWSYGVASSIRSARGQGIVLSNSPVQTDKTKESLQELVKEYANISGAKPISTEELKDAQTNDTLGLPGSFETVAQLSGAYSTILQYGLPDDYYNVYTRKALSLTPDQANTLARQLFVPSKLLWIIVGDMSKVEAGIRELNIGEVHRIDAEGSPAP